MTVVLLALDPADSTGWACSDGTHGVRRLAMRRGELTNDAQLVSRAASFSEWLADLLTETGAGIVVCERGGAKGGNINLHYCTLVAAICGIRDVCLVTVDPKTWQAWAKRSALWDRESKSDENDARAILAWAEANVAYEVSI